jgi:hypothetical protein
MTGLRSKVGQGASPALRFRRSQNRQLMRGGRS